MKAVYAGSFECYTNGHHDIVRKACRMCDELHIVIAVNRKKTRTYDEEAVAEAVKAVLAYEKTTNCLVSVCHGLVAEYCRKNDADYFVRGLRNNMDCNYEENVAEVNKLVIPEMDTVYFRANIPGISSSMIKELFESARDISAYVPAEVWEYIEISRKTTNFFTQKTE